MFHLEAVDVEEYLESRGIQYTPSGSKNVGSAHIGISCPFCGDHSYSGDNHLGINLETKLFSCWICSAKGALPKLVMQLESCKYGQALKILREFSRTDLSQLPAHNYQPQRKERIQIPADRDLSPRVSNYLKQRGFDPQTIHKKYGVYDGGVTGRFRHRAVIPIIFKKGLVNLIARDITGQMESKYIALPNDEAVLPTGSLIYNFDSVKGVAIVVEGPTDVWRIGDGAVALLRKKFTQQQVKLLSSLQKIYILLDSDAVDMAEDLATDVGAFTDVELIELTDGDPAELTNEEVQYLRLKAFGK